MPLLEADFMVIGFGIERIPGFGDSVTIRLAGKAGVDSPAEAVAAELQQSTLYRVSFQKVE